MLTPSFNLVLELWLFRVYFGFVCGWFCLGGNGDCLCIVAAILDVANSCASKTRILFGANLSFSFLRKCLHAF